MTTTSYGNITLTGGTLTVEDYVTGALGRFAGEYDVDAIAAEYREAVNGFLPDGVTLNGNEFYGPYPRTMDDSDLKAAVDSVSDQAFWDMVARHELLKVVTNTEHQFEDGSGTLGWITALDTENPEEYVLDTLMIPATEDPAAWHAGLRAALHAAGYEPVGEPTGDGAEVVQKIRRLHK